MRLALTLLLLATTASAQQTIDETYTAEIRKQTTEARFLTELVDHLPASDTVPSPLEFHGYIAGAEGKLTYAEDVYRYMRALAQASPRVRVLDGGRTEEGRESIVVVIANEETIANLPRYTDVTRRLADPRKISDDEARTLIAQGKPIYYATGAMHSPETGSPEMLMELAYRLAVEETPFIRAIRDNVITIFTPVLEVDGRNRQVDLWRYREKNPALPTPPLIYWGKYVAHDNNRDQIGMALALSQNAMRVYNEFHPQVMHDLHESVPFLYISTGTGPFNPALDPLMIDEWHRMGFHEMDELTRRGLPGVWLHGFWDGWAPNYLFWLGAGRNTIARFYETFGNRWPTTEKRVVRGASERAWFRQNPALPEVRWSLRNNVNYQQSGVLFALHDMAQNRERFLERFWMMGKRAIAKPQNEGPAAWVIDRAQKRQGQVYELVTLLRRQGVEVHEATEAFSIETQWPPQKGDKKAEPVKFASGSYIVRMDQPYSRLADTLLDVQYVRGEERVYDDTGWTLGYLKNVDVRRVVNPDILKVKMTQAVDYAPAAARPGAVFAVANHAETDVVRMRYANPSARVSVAEEEFTSGKTKFPAGTLIVEDPGVALAKLHHGTTALTAKPNVKTRELRAPRIAVLHTWFSTQDEGWWRLALESMNVPYDYISTQDVAVTPNLRETYDAILFPPVGTRFTPQELVNGYAPGPPLPWKKTDLTPNLGGVDETDDMRPGLGLTGVANLLRFVEDGGVLVTSRDTSVWAIEYGLARWVRVVDTNKLKAPGTIVQGAVTDKTHPIARGYDEKLPLYFSGSPVFRVGFRDEPPATETRPSGRGGKDDPDVPQGRPFVPTPERPKPGPGEAGFQPAEDAPWNLEAFLPRVEDRPKVVVSFAEKDLLLSGMLEGADELSGKPAVIDVPRGKGHVILMSVNPMWRMNTSGMYALVMNAVMEMAGAQ
ncbi:MAG TPA: M14 family zinc carboxypeptidase [Thermoanaerobaculia bacterium]|nr:M14 family zinc carboxypeptidase [Thermoanaerobaculia bacterium]